MNLRTALAYLIIFASTGLSLFSCQQKSKTSSFYYWKTSFQLAPEELDAIKDNQVKSIYIRYFDIDFAPGDPAPKPVSPISFDKDSIELEVMPVIYIKNRTFDHLDSLGITQLCQNVFKMVKGINQSIHQNPKETQFDCDWTASTKEKYFLFLRHYRSISQQTISSTIRLHQIKFQTLMGIPPVDRGVLMYYNMGEIGPGTNSSIYEKSIAEKYNPFIKNYPLPLDAALPIFSWGLLISDGKVQKLLNKMYFSNFENDSNFMATKKDWFSVRHSNFHGGYYFKENDQVKIEHVTDTELMDMILEINKYSSHRIHNLIFYDLDKTNLRLYDKDIFKEILAALD